MKSDPKDQKEIKETLALRVLKETRAIKETKAKQVQKAPKDLGEK